MGSRSNEPRRTNCTTRPAAISGNGVGSGSSDALAALAALAAEQALTR